MNQYDELSEWILEDLISPDVMHSIDKIINRVKRFPENYKTLKNKK